MTKATVYMDGVSLHNTFVHVHSDSESNATSMARRRQTTASVLTRVRRSTMRFAKASATAPAKAWKLYETSEDEADQSDDMSFTTVPRSEAEETAAEKEKRQSKIQEWRRSVVQNWEATAAKNQVIEDTECGDLGDDELSTVRESNTLSTVDTIATCDLEFEVPMEQWQKMTEEERQEALAIIKRKKKTANREKRRKKARQVKAAMRNELAELETAEETAEETA